MVNDLDRIVTIAGIGTEGYSGDGKSSISAQLFRPYGLAIDKAGNIYIADTYNHCIRKVLVPITPDTAIQDRNTFMGRQYVCLKGIERGTIVYYTLDGSEPTHQSTVYTDPFCIMKTTTIKIKVYDPRTRIWSATTSTTFTRLKDEGNIITIAGNGTAGCSGDGEAAIRSQLNKPSAVAVDRIGNIYIADTNNHQIRKVDLKGNISTIAGTGRPGYSGDGGFAVSAKLSCPNYITLDNEGNLYISDSLNNCIRRIDHKGYISTVAGSGKAGYSGDGGYAKAARLEWPNGIAFDSANNLYIADTYNHCIRKVDKLGIITTIAGIGSAGYSGDGDSAALAELNWPYGLAVGYGNQLFVCDNQNNSIRMIDEKGIIKTVVTAGRMNWPYGIALDEENNLYFADTYNNCIKKIWTPFTGSVEGHKFSKVSNAMSEKKAGYITGFYTLHKGHVVENVIKRISRLDILAMFVLALSLRLIK